MNKTTAHTPGPWIIPNDYGVKVMTKQGLAIADCGILTKAGKAGLLLEQRANAELIASAPDLLKERDELREQGKLWETRFDILQEKVKKLVSQKNEYSLEIKNLQSLNAELLEALKLIMVGAKNAVKQGHDKNPQLNGGIVLAEDAIAKAEGRTNEKG